MKRVIHWPFSATILAAVAIFFSLSGCTDNNPAQQYGNTLNQSLKSAKKLDSAVNLEQVQKSIQEFHAANGRYPNDLDEVSTFNGITLKNDRYDYDPSTGSITAKQ